MSDEHNNDLDMEVGIGDLDTLFPEGEFLTTEQQVEKLVQVADAMRTMTSQSDIDEIVFETSQISDYMKESNHIVVPRKAIPNDQERLAEIKRVMSSKAVVPFNRGIRARLKPEKYESLDDYVARCAGRTPSQSKAEVEEAVAKVSELSKLLLKEVEEGRVFHISEKKALRQQLKDHVIKAKEKFLSKKDELFWKLVSVAGKHLKVGSHQ